MNIFRPRQCKEAELDAEIRSHLEEAISERVERGETPEEARANALREFGNIGLVKEITRDMWGPRVFERLGQDLRFALRSIRRRTLLSSAVTLTLMLGIGVSTGVFSWFNALFLRARIDKDYGAFVRVYAAYTDDPTRFVVPHGSPGRSGLMNNRSAKHSKRNAAILMKSSASSAIFQARGSAGWTIRSSIAHGIRTTTSRLTPSCDLSEVKR
jgi:hypothetical protein